MAYQVSANITGEPSQIQQRNGQVLFNSRSEAEQFQRDLKQQGFNRVDILEVQDQGRQEGEITAPANRPDIKGGQPITYSSNQSLSSSKGLTESQIIKLQNVDTAINKRQISLSQRESLREQIIKPNEFKRDYLTPERRQERESQAQKLYEQSSRGQTAAEIIKPLREIEKSYSEYSSYQNLRSSAYQSKQNQLSDLPLTTLGRPYDIDAKEYQEYNKQRQEQIKGLKIEAPTYSLSVLGIPFQTKEVQRNDNVSTNNLINNESSFGEVLTHTAMGFLPFPSPSELGQPPKQSKSFLDAPFFGKEGQDLKQFGDRVSFGLPSYAQRYSMFVGFSLLPTKLARVTGLGFTGYESGKTVLNPTKENFASLIAMGGLGLYGEQESLLKQFPTIKQTFFQRPTNRNLFESIIPEGNINKPSPLKTKYQITKANKVYFTSNKEFKNVQLDNGIILGNVIDTGNLIIETKTRTTERMTVPKIKRDFDIAFKQEQVTNLGGEPATLEIKKIKGYASVKNPLVEKTNTAFKVKEVKEIEIENRIVEGGIKNKFELNNLIKNTLPENQNLDISFNNITIVSESLKEGITQTNYLKGLPSKIPKEPKIKNEFSRKNKKERFDLGANINMDNEEIAGQIFKGKKDRLLLVNTETPETRITAIQNLKVQKTRQLYPNLEVKQISKVGTKLPAVTIQSQSNFNSSQQYFLRNKNKQKLPFVDVEYSQLNKIDLRNKSISSTQNILNVSQSNKEKISTKNILTDRFNLKNNLKTNTLQNLSIKSIQDTNIKLNLDLRVKQDTKTRNDLSLKPKLRLRDSPIYYGNESLKNLFVSNTNFFQSKKLNLNPKKTKISKLKYKGTPSVSVVLGGKGTKLSRSQIKGSFINPYQIRSL